MQSWVTRDMTGLSFLSINKSSMTGLPTLNFACGNLKPVQVLPADVKTVQQEELYGYRCSMLSDLIDHVPQLLEYLPSDSLAAILGTSSALHHKLHNHATKIIGHISDQDIAVLARSPWP